MKHALKIIHTAGAGRRDPGLRLLVFPLSYRPGSHGMSVLVYWGGFAMRLPDATAARSPSTKPPRALRPTTGAFLSRWPRRLCSWTATTRNPSIRSSAPSPAHPEYPDLYIALSKTYVAQDKLLDAEQMLSRITNDIRQGQDARLSSPQHAPSVSPDSG
jgi:hypothetical protein